MREDLLPIQGASAPESQRSVLIVDDDAVTVRFFAAGLKGLASQGWTLLFASHGLEALDVLSRQSVDVLVTDLAMPVMDGFSVIAQVHARYPTIPVLAITALPEGEAQDRALQLGALQVLGKPVRMSLLMKEIVRAGNMRPQGQVRGLSLAGMLQLLGWEEKSCTLKVRQGARHGHIYLKRGRLVNAELETLYGVAAAMQLLRWDRPVIEFVESCRVKAALDVAIPELLMDDAVARDHATLLGH